MPRNKFFPAVKIPVSSPEMRLKASKNDEKLNKIQKKSPKDEKKVKNRIKPHSNFTENGSGDYCHNINKKLKEDEKKKQKNSKIIDKHSNKEENVHKPKQTATKTNQNKKKQVKSAENCNKNITETCNETELNKIAKAQARKIAEKHFPQIENQFIQMLNGKFDALAKSLEETGDRAKEERKQLKLKTKKAREEMTVEIVKKIEKRLGGKKVKENQDKIPSKDNPSCCNSQQPKRRLKLPSASLQIIEEEYFVPLEGDFEELYYSRPWTDSTISDSLDSTDED
ncbi:unnamed protein product [Ceutorhynchus assimilis]|uniref:Uncharacterized protein n=1 Tax=Ceutorhynchus assimilis TaxID=467358 RepID=A0A9N9MUI1_9CUCU|nr:unnamed protein product [Ceutorhynchus assimilis]